MRRIIIALLAVATCLILLNCTWTGSAEAWQAGDEKAIFGHTFEEESWYKTITNETEDGTEAEFGVSFVNMGNIEAFLITLNGVEDAEGNTGILPYQMFGMHYFSPEGQEIFIGALLAFMMLYNDTNEDGIPNPDEDKAYVIPFGVSGWVDNGTYPPTVTNHKVKKISSNHYQMGITYENMYAIVTNNYWATALLRTGFVAKFSELSVTYDIKVDEETGELTAETFYTIGEVTELWLIFLGIPFKVQGDLHRAIDDRLGLAAVHFTTVFTSNYQVTQDGNEFSTNVDKEVEGAIDLEDGQGSRAFSIGFRGEYDLIDEATTETIDKDQDAKNVIMQAKFNDLVLVAWQLGFSAVVFAGMAYGLSEYVRGQFTSIDDLSSDSTSGNQNNQKGFGAKAFWYGVCFPSFDGYRVEHDPTYTAYFGEASTPEEEEEDKGPGFEIALVLTSVMILVAVYAVRSRKK
jgi:hypothetical protein